MQHYYCPPNIINTMNGLKDTMKGISIVESGGMPPKDFGKIPISKIDLPYPNKESLPRKAPRKKKTTKPNKKNTEVTSELFGKIGNPDKMNTSPVPSPVHKFGKKKKNKRNKGSSVDSMSSISFGSSSDNTNFSMSSGSIMSGSSYEEREKFTKQRREEEIMQEKIEMLTRISKMSKDGCTVTRKWSLKDEIDDIRFECYRLTRETNSKKSIKKMQHILISIATMIEFANGIVNPFNLKLSGFSQNLMLTVSDYDDSMEELHHKWSGRSTFGPEMTILFTFLTSVIFHHAGNVSSAQQAQQAQQTQQAPKKSGSDMSSVLGMFANMMPTKKSPVPVPTSAMPETTTNNANVGATNAEPKKRSGMKGPSTPMFENLTPSMKV